MKKSIVAAISLLLLTALLLPGCKKKGTEEPVQDTQPIEAPVLREIEPGEAKVGLCIYHLEDSYMALYSAELVRYLVEDCGFTKENIVLLDGANSETTQKAQIEKCITDGADLLIVNPVDPFATAELTDKVVASGIPLIYINREPTLEEQQRWGTNNWPVTYVGCDARQAGLMQGQIIADLGLGEVDRNGNGQIDYLMIMGEPESESAQYRTEFSIRALEDVGIETHCLEQERGDWDRLRSKEITAAAVEAYGYDLEVIFCNNDDMALGALEALQAADRIVNEDIFLVGCDALPEALDAMQAGNMTGTVLNDQFSQAEAAGKAAIRFLKGEANEIHINCDYVKVVPGNVQTILSRIR